MVFSQVEVTVKEEFRMNWGSWGKAAAKTWKNLPDFARLVNAVGLLKAISGGACRIWRGRRRRLAIGNESGALVRLDGLDGRARAVLALDR